ncbi:MAG: hypothetical protein GTO53_10030, partial [Planctomycetales bacterium]|nr:hypothetical protein [Planctomycetales bacterium]NIM09458.1 hypothetical protein [Planctomycetales bacterium]NIN08946.1 hypothetical protein [Planctomycetales bacterium]NIN78061.1 hypothetical protein [Planctomycetales bacterium]NIO35239.1 hypothetical protein [Planctomycetales bacterium]
RRLSRRWLTGFAIAAGLLCGVFWGWPRDRASLLRGAVEGSAVFPLATEIPRQGNGRRQYEYALLLNSEEGWYSVLEFYPADRHHGRLARKQLAELYLSENRLFEALRVFQQLARAGEAEPGLRAYGLAGQYVVYTLEGLPDRAKSVLLQLWPLRERLARYDRQMAVRVAQLASRSQQLEDQAKQQELDAFLSRHVDNQEAD